VVRRHAHVQVVRRREGPAARYDAWVDGVEGIVRCEEAGRVTSDVGSAFFGGQGLRPPFRPLVHHEALAWARVEPARVVAHGVGPEGPYVALRRLPGVSLAALAAEAPLDAAGIEAIAVDVAAELAALHSVGVLHRDLRPDTVLLVDGRARLAGLAACSVDGCGPPLATGPGSVAADLAALGRLLTGLLAGRPPSVLAHPLAAACVALGAPDPAARPGSADELLRALGHPGAPPPAVPRPHAALLAWPSGAWADRLVAQGHVEAVVRQIDAAPPDRWALAGVAARLLDGDRGAQGWLALATLAWLLGERTSGPDRDAYRAQAEEARARAGAPWHPAARGVAALLAAGPRVAPLCEVGLPRHAEALARREGEPGKLALAGWAAGDAAVVEEGLAEASPTDLDAVRVAASRLLARAGAAAPPGAARFADPDAQLEAVRELCVTGAEEAALRLATSFPEPVATRARLTIALAVGERAEAVGIARVLAVRGAWDQAVAATLVLHAPESELVRHTARRVLQALAPREEPARLRARAGEAVSADPADPVAWSGLVWARVAGGEVERVAGELDRHGAGAAAWRLLALELFAAGQLDDARAAAHEGLRRRPDDAALSTLDACLALFDGDPDGARRAADHGLVQAPRAPWPWLARAACATWRGDELAAAGALAAARRAGADGPSVGALAACLPPRSAP
jgi:hypothetical protein